MNRTQYLTVMAPLMIICCREKEWHKIIMFTNSAIQSKARSGECSISLQHQQVFGIVEKEQEQSINIIGQKRKLTNYPFVIFRTIIFITHLISIIIRYSSMNKIIVFSMIAFFFTACNNPFAIFCMSVVWKTQICIFIMTPILRQVLLYPMISRGSRNGSHKQPQTLPCHRSSNGLTIILRYYHMIMVFTGCVLHHLKNGSPKNQVFSPFLFLIFRRWKMREQILSLSITRMSIL